MTENGILHFSVNAAGNLRLFETANDVQRCKAPDSVALQLSLTTEQMRVVLRAQAHARQRKENRLPGQ